jgi:hypothetical protein
MKTISGTVERQIDRRIVQQARKQLGLPSGVLSRCVEPELEAILHFHPRIGPRLYGSMNGETGKEDRDVCDRL